jgi:hypothetical protein
MTSEDERQIAQLMREALRRSRGHASFFEWAPNRDLEELGVAGYFRESLEHRGQPSFDRIASRGRGNDPPDCEALGPDGKPIAIEVTELVNPAAIIAFKHNKAYEWNEWSREELQGALRRQLIRKAACYASLKGGPYAEYIVLIYTDEPMLPYDTATRLLDAVTFEMVPRIDRAFLLISYDQNLGYCPYLQLRLSGRGDR